MAQFTESNLILIYMRPSCYTISSKTVSEKELQNYLNLC